MARLALVMHEPLGSAFVDCAAHILGHELDILVFDVKADDPPDESAQRLERLLEARSGDGILILCDIYGATPFNIASRVVRNLTARGTDVALVTGTNLCMVLKALTDNHENPEALSEKVREGALKGIVRADCFS
ncbi:MAG TPA: PTS sugar transporter subunit IIA [Pusillimonas sp.]|uniref:PTS sugar transporter subunit IIA n=1 Tax=Pusillimonas sp. TaxID=3040095 RepID=UPI002BF15514|nr:PTS sugar transporter subunit IIA [Pusillimonas sp.]HUH88553.1 PTS sugar transporter subunit IIA [Pusillimonas sp.]